jgi:hypothetical protein
MSTNNEVKTNKITPKLVFSWVALGLCILSLVVYLLAPAIVIDQSYAFNQQVDAGKTAFIDLKDWSFTVPGFAALFGIGTYDVYVTAPNTSDVLVLQQDKMVFNPFMLIGIIVALIAFVLYLVLVIKKIKNNVLNKITLGLFVVAASMFILTAVWFYAMNPIVESNYYDTKTRLDTVYKYVNAHLSFGPIFAGIGLLGSAIFTAIGEY